jgi:hypothetical protein
MQRKLMIITLAIVLAHTEKAYLLDRTGYIRWVYNATRFRSTQNPHAISSHKACADHATAVADGGGGPNRFAA